MKARIAAKLQRVRGFGSPPPSLSFKERHYTIEEIASLWGVSKSTVRRLFIDAKGVLKINSMGRKRYVTLRVPESVLSQYHRSLS